MVFFDCIGLAARSSMVHARGSRRTRTRIDRHVDDHWTARPPAHNQLDRRSTATWTVTQAPLPTPPRPLLIQSSPTLYPPRLSTQAKVMRSGATPDDMVNFLREAELLRGMVSRSTNHQRRPIGFRLLVPAYAP